MDESTFIQLRHNLVSSNNRNTLLRHGYFNIIGRKKDPA